MENIIGLENYANEMYNGSGSSSQGELDALYKALSAGSITGRETVDSLTASGAPLKVESLEKNLKVITFKESDITLWRKIPKLPAFNTVEEYNRLVSYGTERGGFTTEGELPDTEDSVYQRKGILVKFMGVTREVTHPMTLVNTNIGSIIQREITNGTMYILRKVDRALTKGDSSLVSVEFDGLYKQHMEGYANLPTYLSTNNLVIDMRGKALSESSMEDAVQRIIDNFGVADTFFSPPIVLSNFIKTFYQYKRQLLPAGNDTKVGFRTTEFQSQFGSVGLNFDKFMNRLPNKKSTDGATSDKASAAPTPDGSAPITAVGSDATALWGSGDAGTYYYLVTGINRYGESAPAVLSSSGTAILSGGAVDLKWATGGGTYPATGFRVYRSNAGAASSSAATYYPLFELSLADLNTGSFDGASGANVVRDRNRLMPNTDQAFMLEQSEDIYSFKQLAPLMKMQLAQLSPAYRFMVLLYGTPVLYQPSKLIRFTNIGNG